MEFKKVIALMDQIIETGVPGNDCAIFYKGEQIFRHSAGVADRETGAPMRPNQRYNIYSASKVLTATCGMKLIEEGKMALTDPLYKYLPEYEHMMVKTADGIVPAKNQITIRDLFCMTAGFNYDLVSPSLKACREETGGVCSTRDVARYLAREPLLYEPGTNWLYSLAHDVLGAVIEVVSGMTFGEFMKQTIFDKCDMKDTAFRYRGDPLEDERFCPQYVFKPESGVANRQIQQGGTIERYTLNVPYVLGSAHESGGAGLTSTLEDYCRFQEGMVAGKVLKPETLQLMQTPQLNEAELKGFNEWMRIKGYYTYGLGVRVVLPEGDIAVPEFGWGGAAGALTMMDTVNHITLYYTQHVLGTGGSKAEPFRAKIKQAAYEDMGFSWWKEK